MELKNYIVSWILTAIVIFAMIFFVVQTQQDNNIAYNQSIVSNQIINNTYSNVHQLLIDSQTNASTQYLSVSNETVKDSPFAIVMISVVGVGKILSAFTFGIYQVTIGAAATFLGINPAIMAAITAIVLIIFIFALWRFWRNAQ